PYARPTGPGPWITRRSTCCSTATTAPAPSSSETPRSINPSQVSSTSCSRSCGGPVAAGEIDTERIEAAMPASLRRQLATWRDEDDGGGDLPDGALAACMIIYAQLH